jgi:uncharacterized membrane protein YeaQ/YmgE (transglycosylase-associated protein family)
MSASPVPRRVIAVAVLIPIGLGLLVSWFAWPAREIEPRDLPVVVAGPQPAAGAFASQLAAARPGAFTVTVVDTEAAADDALRHRGAYAAFVLTGSAPALHTASAASPAVAQALTALAQQLGRGPTVAVVDVVPGTADDPRGAGFGSGFLPLVLAGLVAGVLLSFLVPTWRSRLAGVFGYAVIAGLVGSLVLVWLGLVPGSSYLACAPALSLVALAISSAVTGLGALLGRPGIALAVLVIFLFGIPISAVAAAPELLPQPWGTVGQLLPAGAAGNLLRSAAFFDWHGAAGPLWTLAAWAVGGLILVVIGRARLPGAPSHGSPASPASPAAALRAAA